ncbi:DNA-binding NarL/FixJ family response regulator [Deinococcus radiopugnans ATCC 19172]|uniref:DNA-binding NarL/FixJ family response regulator n=1 Tax=Deinococcus radiopugnans ATCC 19172 TaxID=585398 RepID=A0ABR6NTR0_9DEIO|nr:DNA-binding NarL/FixJ family response regulator [Deinococcus radiopugnans ATCC 19172]
MTPITVAIVDDQPLMRFGLRALFDSRPLAKVTAWRT